MSGKGIVMWLKKRIGKKVWVALAVVIVVQVLFDPLTSLIELMEGYQAQIGLPSARQKWESQNISHYKFDIKGYVPLACIVGGSVEVKDGVVIKIGPSSTAVESDNPFLDTGFTSMEHPFLCNYKNYTIPSFFDYLSEHPNSITGISFDLDYGFISHYRFGSSGGHGLLSPRIYDCCGGFGISNFQMLDAEP